MRGQSGIEFIILLGFLMMVFIGFSFVIQENIKEQNLQNRRAMSVQLADLIEGELLLAAAVTPGYSREFELPRTLDGEYYNVSIEDRDTLVIDRGDEEYIRFLSINATFVPPILAAPTDRRVVDFANSPVVLIQKNAYGCLYLNRRCINDSTPLKDCVIPESAACDAP